MVSLLGLNILCSFSPTQAQKWREISSTWAHHGHVQEFHEAQNRSEPGYISTNDTPFMMTPQLLQRSANSTF